MKDLIFGHYVIADIINGREIVQGLIATPERRALRPWDIRLLRVSHHESLINCTCKPFRCKVQILVNEADASTNGLQKSGSCEITNTAP